MFGTSLYVTVVSKRFVAPFSNAVFKAVRKAVTVQFPGVIVNVCVLLASSTSTNVLLHELIF